VNASTLLQQRWQELLQASRVTEARGAPAFAELCAAYQQAQRHYHTLAHLEHMLDLVHESGNARAEALWATWYHDVIYRPGRNDNEKRSAELAGARMASLGVSPECIDRARQIILATRSHTFAGIDPILQGVLDADMAILGAPPERYREYCEQVRREFGWTPGPLFERGRRHFIEAVLAQERVFATDWFFQRFEAQARTNLAAELERL
jgi:predicted metal-dependent HD superfamily phosphohydrolase